MKKLSDNRKNGLLVFFALFGLLMADVALAAFGGNGGGNTALAWEEPLCRIALSLSGPVAKAVAIIIFVLSGLAMAAGEASGIMKTLIMTIFGLSLALMGAQWLGMLGSSATATSSAASCAQAGW